MPGGAGGYAGPYGFVIGRSERAGDFKDVRIRTTPEGFNYVELARDARDVSPRRYVVDRLIKPDGYTTDGNSPNGNPNGVSTAGGNLNGNPSIGAWTRVVEVDSFTKDASPDRMSETRCEITYAPISNSWGIKAEPVFGLPGGMESPWATPTEMVANELLIPLTDTHREPDSTDEARDTDAYTVYVSGDAPLNVAAVSGGAFGTPASGGDSGTSSSAAVSNGAYTVVVGERDSTVEVLHGGKLLGRLPVAGVGARNVAAVEGIAGVVYYDGGEVYLEPAKPPQLFGSYLLPFDVRFIQDGLYEAVGVPSLYVITSEPVEGRRASGMVSLVSDPYPERWVSRMMGRAYTRITSPALVPPLVEEDPRRISVLAVELENDFPDLPREVVTPYANKTGVFNSWESDSDAVDATPRIRPYDLLLTFDGGSANGDVVDYGANPTYPDDTAPAPGESRRVAGRIGGLFDSEGGYRPEESIDLASGSLAFRFRDSAEFEVIRSPEITVYYRTGYLYMNRGAGYLASSQDTASAGLYELDLTDYDTDDFVPVRIEWGENLLRVNGRDADTTTNTWADVLFVGDTDTERTWADVAGVERDDTPGGNIPSGSTAEPPNTSNPRNPNLPETVLEYEDVSPEWETGRPVRDAADSDGDKLVGEFLMEARTWGRVLFEDFRNFAPERTVGDMSMTVGELSGTQVGDLG